MLGPPSHWLDEISLPKWVCHHFWPRLIPVAKNTPYQLQFILISSWVCSRFFSSFLEGAILTHHQQISKKSNTRPPSKKKKKNWSLGCMLVTSLGAKNFYANLYSSEVLLGTCWRAHWELEELVGKLVRTRCEHIKDNKNPKNSTPPSFPQKKTKCTSNVQEPCMYVNSLLALPTKARRILCLDSL
jgi:hypothetical protein